MQGKLRRFLSKLGSKIIIIYLVVHVVSPRQVYYDNIINIYINKIKYYFYEHNTMIKA